MKRIYLDHAATTPLSEAARKAMLPWLDCGNPSSLYEEGRRAKADLDRAREIVSGALGCLFAEVVFTSSGTEAANHALIGAALGNKDTRRNRILLGAAEHHCVLTCGEVLRRLGYTVEIVPVTREGQVAPEALEELIDERVLLVAVMHANNELGTINDVAALTEIAHGAGALMVVDAVQTFGVSDRRPPLAVLAPAPRATPLPWRGEGTLADLLIVSAHKIGGPKGVGALYVRAGTALKPLIYGGGQERELRGGTENVAAIAGFAAAVQEAATPTCEPARNEFEQILVEAGAVPTVTSAPRLPGHCHVRFPGLDAETALIRLDREGVSASSGAACSSGSIEPSHVMLAAGYSEREAKEALRFTFGRDAEVGMGKEAAARVVETIRSIRKP